MSTSGLVYQLCDNDYALQGALRILRSSSEIILDCEGEKLGKQGGSLSIISLRSTATMDIFLIDVIGLRSSLSPLFDLLQSTEIVKIMFDGRMDFSALYHEFGVHLRNVIDLQLVDIRSRQSRGETNVGRVRRLSSYLNARYIALSPGVYAPAVKLSGLSLCVEEHLGQLDIQKTTGNLVSWFILSVDNIQLVVDHSNWLKRPLSQAYLSYAATDIHLMGLLYDHFSVKGYIHMSEHFAQSMRYIELWKDEKPVDRDPYKGHPLLPLEILALPSDSIKRVCSGCKRHLSQASFHKKKIRCRICDILKKSPAFRKKNVRK